MGSLSGGWEGDASEWRTTARHKRNTPVQVVGPGGSGFLTGITAISSGLNASLALKSDGTVWAWGDNAYGELGTGSTRNSSVPVQAGSFTGATAISAGQVHSLAAVTLPTQAAPANTQYNDAPYAGTGGAFVNSFTGAFSYTYSHTDLAIPGRGPSPTFVRSYNSNDTRAGPLGPGWTHNYNAHLSLSGGTAGTVVLDEPDGRSDVYTTSDGGAYTAPPAVYTTLVRNNDGSFTATQKDQSQWLFSGAGQLVKVTDRYGNASVLTYNAQGQLTSVSDPAGRGSLSFGYNGNGLLTSVADWTSPQRTVQLGYDGSGRLQSVTDRNGKTTTYGYDGATSHLTTIVDANNHTTITNTYDTQGRVLSQKDALGLSTGQATTYSYGTNTTTITYPTTSYQTGFHPTVTDTYSSQGQLTQRVTKPSSAESYTESWTYDSNFNTTSHTDARGNTTTFCYDVDYSGTAVGGSHGNLRRVIAPAPAAGQNPLVTLSQFDAKNNLTETVRPKGVNNGSSVTCATNLAGAVNTLYATDTTYDSSGVYLQAVTRRFTDPETGQQTAKTTYEYTDAANLGLATWITPPRGNTGGSPDHGYATNLTYYGSGSQAGMLQQSKDAAGDATSFTYDAVGRKLTMVDPNGQTWGYQYDGEDHVTQASAPAPQSGGSALVTQQQYDPVGNKTVVVDANGQVTKYLYDVRNMLQEVDQSPSGWTDPNATPSPLYRTTYAYDNPGNLSRMTRAAGDSANERATDYAYDGKNLLRTETQYPSWPATTPTLVTTYAYDGDGDQASVVAPKNQTTQMGYDNDDRLTSITYVGGGAPNVAYTLDADGNRTQMVDGTGTTTYASDELDRITSVTSPGSVTVGTRYDLDGNRRKLVYPGATGAVTYTFDNADRMQSLQDWAGRTTSYQYFPDGHLKLATNPNGTTATYSEDNDQRLTQVWNQSAGGATISQHAYTLDGVGNRTAVAETLAQVGGGTATNNVSNVLDRLYRLTSDGTTASYSYDPAGNRLTKGGTAYSYDKADRITAAGSTSYTVDADGNTIARGADSFAYDQANRLTAATVGGATTTDTYDGDGKRASQTAGGSTTTYAYDVMSGLPNVLADGSRTYVYGLGLAYTADGTGAVQVYHADGLGSVRALTDATGTVAQTYQTDAFGVPTQTQGTSAQPFGYAGQQVDPSGLVYLRARFYDPAAGRFMGRDPVMGTPSDPVTLNRYAYAQDNPALNTDPGGRCGPACGVAVAAGCLLDPVCAVVVGGGTALALGIAAAHQYLQQHPLELPQRRAPGHRGHGRGREPHALPHAGMDGQPGREVGTNQRSC